MSKSTYQGSCHCGTVRVEADLDLSQPSGRCNCSFCGKSRAWSILIKPTEFRVLAGADNLGDYQFGTKQGHHRFCKHCGIYLYGHGDVPELGGAFVSVRVSCLDLEPERLAAIAVHYGNGRDNDWASPPKLTSYL